MRKTVTYLFFFCVLATVSTDMAWSDILDNGGSTYPQFSGIYPHLAVTNGTTAECGIGAAVPWPETGSLWFMTYTAHSPLGSDDKLYQLNSQLQLTIRPESIGGTPANRMIHIESNQLIIASYLINDQGNVRTIPFSQMPGRMTATARHLTDPTNKVYFITMEEGLYEVDVNTLAVTTLHKDRNAGGSDLLPGNHGKGGYTGQGRLVVSNNGHGGVLAEWDGTGNAGDPASWTIIDGNKYTDITSRGGIYGVPDTAAPLWAIGWDNKSVLLNVCDNGGQWQRFRLPKSSYTQDADHGWFTEWPRIREAEPGRLLMDMHCMYYEFPQSFSHANTAGIVPISTHLKMVVDYAYWNGKLVQACDDASHFKNPLLGRNQSNLWFGSMSDLAKFGKPAGWGGPWVKQSVQANQPSEPYLFNGFEKRIVHLCHDKDTPVTFALEIDTNGSGSWTENTSVVVPASGYAYYVFPSGLNGQWVRVKTDSDINSATAYFHYASSGQTTEPTMFQSLAAANQAVSRSEGIVRPDSGSDLKLQFAAKVINESGNIVDSGYYEIGEDMQLVRVNNPSTESWLWSNAATTQDFQVDNASIIMTDSSQNRYRLPKGDQEFDNATASGWCRGIREIVTERSLMNIHGTFYELPRELSGGLAKIRPITTHNRMIYDYCSWRGMLILSGNLTNAVTDDHYIQSDDSKVGLWFGNVDDLWKLGIPRGMGGPWKDTAVQANTSSDPYLMTGYNNKSVELSHNLQEDVVFAIEVDFLADRSWHVYKSISVPAGKTIVHKFPDGFSAHWVRLKTNKSCTATAWFIYNEDMWITGNREFVHTTEIEIKTGAEITPDEIRYTLDGSEPNATSEVYTVPFVLDHSATVKAIALVASIVVASATASFEKIILPPPIINPSGGKYIISKTVTIEPPAAVSNAEIRYTSDGSEPSSDSLLYTDSFVLTESTVVRAKTYLNGIGSSDTATELIFILPEVNISNLPQALGAATGLLSMDSLRCSDQYNFNELPSELLGFNYVSINRGDGMQPAPAYSVTVDMPVTAYLLLQDRGDPTIPADWQQAGITSRWLSDYTDTIYWNNYPAGTVDIPGHDGIDYAGWYGVPCMAVVVTHGPPLFRADPLCKSAAFEDTWATHFFSQKSPARHGSI